MFMLDDLFDLFYCCRFFFFFIKLLLSSLKYPLEIARMYSC